MTIIKVIKLETLILAQYLDRPALLFSNNILPSQYTLEQGKQNETHSPATQRMPKEDCHIT